MVRCKPKTLTMESKLPPMYSTQGELKQVLEMVRKKPVRPPVAAVAKTSTAVEESVSAATSSEPAACAVTGS
jgi:hypothetical protein